MTDWQLLENLRDLVINPPHSLRLFDNERGMVLVVSQLYESLSFEVYSIRSGKRLLTFYTGGGNGPSDRDLKALIALCDLCLQWSEDNSHGDLEERT